MTPKLSLIVPCHNHTHCLPRLLDSVLQQTFKDLEAIVVDDYSTESCASVVKLYREKGLNIHLLEQRERIYTHEARLRGIEAAAGDIIAFADADDALWNDDSLEKNVILFQQQNAEILHFRMVRINEEGAFVNYIAQSDPFAPLLEKQAILDGYARADFWGASSLCNKLFARTLCLSALDTARSKDFNAYREDAWLVLICLSLAQRYVGSDTAGYAYMWVEKKSDPRPDQTIAQYKLLKAIPAYLQSISCPSEVIDRVRRNLVHTLCSLAGRMCLTITQGNKEYYQDKENNQAILKHPEKDDLLESLILVNSYNAEKILTIYNIFK